MKAKLNHIVLYVILYFGIIFSLGGLSIVKLFSYYINNKVINNDSANIQGSKFESDFAGSFCTKMQLIDMNGAIRNVLGQQEMNGVIKLNNGYLLSPMDYASDDYLEKAAIGLNEFSQYLQNRGTDLVYIATPYTSGKYDPQLPIGVDDFGNSNIDRLLYYIDSLDVDFIDIREEMYIDGINHYDMMYKTDHHWTTEAGFYTFNILEKYIIDKTGCEVDPRISDICNYEIITYPKWHLGSNGQRTGKYYAGIDDFHLILPKYQMRVVNASKNVEGDVRDRLFSLETLDNRDTSSRYTYDNVFEKTQNHFINENAKNDVKILVISDSFSKAVLPYLIMGFKEIDYKNWYDISEITREYIESYDPDIVIVMYYAGQLDESKELVPFSFLGD